MGTDAAGRAYRSPLREAQAEQTRARVIRAALLLFERDGYGVTTIAAIGREAGVSAETVYAAFRSKRGLLQAVVERADLPGAGQRVRSEWERLAGQPAAQLGALAILAHDFWTTNRQLAGVLNQGTGDSELAEIWHAPQRGRRLLFRALITGWPEGTLADTLDAGRAADILYALTSADVFQLLVGDAGWAPDRYQAELAALLRRALLPPDIPRF